VAVFTGCYLDFVDTPIGEAAIRVLTSNGFEVILPTGQVCCGAPVLYSGDLEGTKELALLNAGAFVEEDVEAVITLCATCGSALREGYRTVAAHLEGKAQERVVALSERVQDVAQFLAVHSPVLDAGGDVSMTFTYHDPCHHIRAHGIREEPRGLLREIPGANLVEMSESARCCGGGGSFGLTYPEVSLEIGRQKVQDILASGAQAVVTACPGCILQIQEVALRENAHLEVLHLVEVLDRSLQIRERG
jgi:glycolate oxidase iron-sulfur subunit